MRIMFFVMLLFISGVSSAADVNGLIVKKSQNNVVTTLDRLQQALEKKGIKIIARVKHSKAAAKVGMKMRPTELLIFGNPKLGSPLMISQQTVGIDLPMKALAWEDKQGQVWLGYNDPNYFAQRHGIKDQSGVLKKMSGALKKLTDLAVSKP